MEFSSGHTVLGTLPATSDAVELFEDFAEVVGPAGCAILRPVRGDDSEPSAAFCWT